FLAGDALNFSNQNGISGSYNAATGVLTLSGTATVAQYQAALESVTFSSSSHNPTSFGTDTSRTVSWVVNDGTANSAAQTSTINITAVNDAPVITNAGNTIGYTELQAVAPAIDAGLTVSDADNLNLASAAVSITNGFLAGDALNFSNQNGISGTYNAATGVLTLSGPATVVQYQAALESVTFSSSSHN